VTDPKKPAEIDDLLQENRSFPPPAAFRAQATVCDESVYERAAREIEATIPGLLVELRRRFA